MVILAAGGGSRRVKSLGSFTVRLAGDSPDQFKTTPPPRICSSMSGHLCSLTVLMPLLLTLLLNVFSSYKALGSLRTHRPRVSSVSSGR